MTSCDGMATWEVLDRGDVPELDSLDVPDGLGAHLVEYDCPHCGAAANLPVVGRPLAQLGDGIAFDIGRYALPRLIRCRMCRKRYERA